MVTNPPIPGGHQMIDVKEIPGILSNWRADAAERDERFRKIADVIAGDLRALDPNGDQLDVYSANVPQVALEDTADAASLLPTLRAQPSGASKEAKRRAERMERIAAGYFDVSKMDLLIPQTTQSLLAYGLGVWVVWPDFELKTPVIEWRDARETYLEKGRRPGWPVQRAMIVRDVKFGALRPEQRAKIMARLSPLNISEPAWNDNITVVDFFTEDELVVAALYHGQAGPYAGVEWIPTELERVVHNLGVCPVIAGERITLDGEIRGQYDQVLGPFLAMIRLHAMAVDYADQSVYSDIWVKDPIGEIPMGGGSFIELGPNGAIGRVPPAVSSMNVAQDLAALQDHIHLGGRWPKTRPGEVEQSIASAKFLEATAGIMNTTIRAVHQALRRMMEQALRVCFVIDKKVIPGTTRSCSGVLRNQEFYEDYETKDIDPKAKVRVEYGLGLGRDPAQSMVLMIQANKAGYVSKQFVMENMDGLTDVAREQRRIHVEQLEDMALAKLLQGLQEKTIPDSALPEIARAREKGESLFDVYEKYIVKPQQEAADTGLQSGLGGGLLPPGPPGLPPMEGPGGAPPPGPTPPAPPGGVDILARLGAPAGPGGLMGTQVQG